MDTCFTESQIANLRLSFVRSDGSEEILKPFDNVQLKPKFGVFFGSVLSSRTLVNNVINPASVMATPTLVTITIYMHVVLLPGSPFNLVFKLQDSRLSYGSDSTTEAGTGTKCTVAGQGEFSCDAMAARVVTAGINGLATFVLKNIHEPSGLLQSPSTSMISVALSYVSDPVMVIVMNDLSEVKLAYYIYSTGYENLGINFLDSITIIILPLSSQAGLSSMSFLTTGPSIASGVPLSCSSSLGAASVTAVISSTSTLTISMGSMSTFGYYVTVSGANVFSTTSAVSTNNPAGFGPSFFRMTVGSYTFTSTSNTQIGPYELAYEATTFTLTTTSVAATSIATTRVRSLTFTFATVIGGNGGNGVNLILTSSGCNVNFAGAIVQSGSLTLNSANSPSITFNVPAVCTKGSACNAVISGVTVTTAAGSVNWPQSLGSSCFSLQLILSGSPVGPPSLASSDVNLYQSVIDLPMYTFVSDVTPVPATALRMTSGSYYTGRYSSDYQSDPINIFGVNFAGRTSKSFALSSTCSALQLQDAAGSSVSSLNFNMDFTVLDLAVVATFRVKISPSMAATSYAFSSCFKIVSTVYGTVLTAIPQTTALPVSYVTAFSVGLVDTTLSTLSNDNAAASLFLLTYELNMILPKFLTSSNELVFTDTNDCFCPKPSGAKLKTSTAPSAGQIQPEVATDWTVTTSGKSIVLRCNAGVPEYRWFSVNLVCPTAFTAEDIHRCVPGNVHASVSFSFAG